MSSNSATFKKKQDICRWDHARSPITASTEASTWILCVPPDPFKSLFLVLGSRGLGDHLWTSIKYRNEPSKSATNGSDQIFSGLGPRPSYERTKRWNSKSERGNERRERNRERRRERERRIEPGQTGPRLAEVAPGPQTINKERSNLWTGSLISTLLLFSHLIDGLLHRFVTFVPSPRRPASPRRVAAAPPPSAVPPFAVSFPPGINTHGGTGREPVAQHRSRR